MKTIIEFFQPNFRCNVRRRHDHQNDDKLPGGETRSWPRCTLVKSSLRIAQETTAACIYRRSFRNTAERRRLRGCGASGLHTRPN